MTKDRSRGHRVVRCSGCHMTHRICICDLFPAPPLETATEILLLTHRDELRRSSNTGRLVAKSLHRARVRVYGVGTGDSALPPVGDRQRPLWVLAPGDHTEVLGPEHAGEEPPTLVLLDATWRQARRWITRNRDTPGVRWVSLPPGAPSEYRLRKDRRPGNLSTLEAAARALALLERDGAQIEARLLELFRVFVDRNLWMRGLLPGEEVTGGLPPRRSAQATPPQGSLETPTDPP